MAASDVLLEELEVLGSIYPTELSKRSDRQIQIDVEPDDPVEGADELTLTLIVDYADGYPDVLPELSLELARGEVSNAEIASLVSDLRAVGEENLGMAMTFTLVSQLREQLSALVRSRAMQQREAEREKERLELEAEEAKTRGTPVTVATFSAWKVNFDKELSRKKALEDEERMKGLASKEREECKRLAMRLTGRQLFERNRHLEDDNLMEEGTVSVDISQYERRLADQDDEEENERVRFSDSD